MNTINKSGHPFKAPRALLSTTLSALGIAALAAGPAVATANDHDEDDEIPFDVAEVFFELNDTDGDLGIHALIDGGPWVKLEIEDPRDVEILDVTARSNLRRQGLTEIFFESAEPTFDELAPRRFFRRFREGVYDVEGRALDGTELESETEVTHVMPAPAMVTVNGEPMAGQCDEDEPGFDITVTSAPVTIAWEEVTMSHPNANGGGAGVQPPVPVTIINYEVVVEAEVTGTEFEAVWSVFLPPESTSVTVPEDILALSDEFKYEVLAREESYNQTAVESCFALEVDEP